MMCEDRAGSPTLRNGSQPYVLASLTNIAAKLRACSSIRASPKNNNCSIATPRPAIEAYGGPDGQIQPAASRQSLQRQLRKFSNGAVRADPARSLWRRHWTKQLAHIRRARQVLGLARPLSWEDPPRWAIL